ncbi:MAG TPA: hypothetical protein VKB76_13175 [Ktedonobacterales bacterium]|nr:hypothetical protein [Ktedonobacterales bacterium]
MESEYITRDEFERVLIEFLQKTDGRLLGVRGGMDRLEAYLDEVSHKIDNLNRSMVEMNRMLMAIARHLGIAMPEEDA